MRPPNSAIMKSRLVSVCLLLISWASSIGLAKESGDAPHLAQIRHQGTKALEAFSQRRSKIRPQFEDVNATTVIGQLKGTIILDCNIFMLQDHTVSWAHKPVDKDGLDLLTIGNSTYTLEPRIAAQFLHPANWGLKISNIQPEDAGTYICQISTFPPKVRILFLEIQGPMIEIVRDQVVYNAGSHLEVACIYKNTTGSKASQDSAEVRKVDEVQRILEVSRQGGRFNQDVPEDTILWLHNGNRFSHRNRRRVKTIRKMDHILSILSIKSAILEDSGNYSCVLASTNHSDTVRLTVVNGEHSAAIYKNSEVLATSGSSGSSLLNINKYYQVNALYLPITLNILWVLFNFECGPGNTFCGHPRPAAFS